MTKVQELKKNVPLTLLTGLAWIFLIPYGLYIQLNKKRKVKRIRKSFDSVKKAKERLQRERRRRKYAEQGNIFKALCFR